jgi:Tubulin-tyrosine ligase family
VNSFELLGVDVMIDEAEKVSMVSPHVYEQAPALPAISHLACLPSGIMVSSAMHLTSVQICTQVWLLEVNSSPSLSLATPLDEKIKATIIEDSIKLVDPLAFDRVALQHVLSRRTQQSAGPGRMSRRQGGGLLAGTLAEEQELLNTELHAVLGGACPRQTGDTPPNLGGFEQIAPCSLLDHIGRLKR